PSVGERSRVGSENTTVGPDSIAIWCLQRWKIGRRIRARSIAPWNRTVSVSPGAGASARGSSNGPAVTVCIAASLGRSWNNSREAWLTTGREYAVGRQDGSDVQFTSAVRPGCEILADPRGVTTCG